MSLSSFSFRHSSRRFLAALAVMVFMGGWTLGALLHEWRYPAYDHAHEARAQALTMPQHEIVTLHIAHFITPQGRAAFASLNLSPEEAVKRLIDRQNMIFTQSGVNLRAVSTGVTDMPQVNSKFSINQVFDSIQEEPYADFMKATRNAQDADFMMVLSAIPNGTGGVSHLNTHQDRDRALAVIDSYSAMPPLSSLYAHELGHSMGLAHDPGASQFNAHDDTHQGNVGHVDLTHRVRDIMSYDTTCQTAQIICNDVLYYTSKDRPVMIKGHHMILGSDRSNEVGYLNARLNRFATMH